jgi:hypothetical protein
VTALATPATQAQGPDTPPVHAIRVSDTAFEFEEAPRPTASEADAVSVDIVDVPIRVWVQRDSNRQIDAIRVTGHATEEICSQASLALLNFVGDDAAVSGFLGFGVAEMRATRRPDGGAFSNAAENVVRRLQVIRADSPTYVQIMDTSPAAPSSSTEPAINDASPTVVVHYQPLAAGPAFIPVRSWSPGHQPEPIELPFDIAVLGPDAKLIDRLEPDINWAPIAEQIERSSDRIRRIARVHEWRLTGKPFDDGVIAFTKRQETRTPTLEEVTGASELMMRFVRKYDAMSLIGSNFNPESVAKIRTQVRNIEAAIFANRICMGQLRRGQACFSFFSAEPDPPTTPKDRAFAEVLSKRLQLIDAFPPEVFAEAIADQEKNIAKLKSLLALNKQTPTKRLARARETTIDGLLRGWPLPVSSDSLSDDVDRVQSVTIPKVWGALFRSLAQRTGTDLTQVERTAGVLERANLFYRVREQSKGKYMLTPTYVVLGRYLEIWDPARRSVTVEAADVDSGMPEAPEDDSL